MLNSKDLKGRYSSTKNWEINIKILKTCAVVSTYQKKKKTYLIMISATIF